MDPEALRRRYELKFALTLLQGTEWMRWAMNNGWVERVQGGLTPKKAFGESPVVQKMNE